jgi:hypothetical protein
MDVLEFNYVNQYRFPRPRHPEPLRKKIIYDGSLRPTHVGYAVRGSATSDAVWIVEKITYDPDGTIPSTLMTAPGQIMDNYAALTYS